jgi:hypothetical protein
MQYINLPYLLWKHPIGVGKNCGLLIFDILWIYFVIETNAYGYLEHHIAQCSG